MSARCEQAVATDGVAASPPDGYNPVFVLAVAEVGSCLPTARMGDAAAVSLWAGGGLDPRWSGFCVACDLGAGFVGQVVGKHYMYRSG